MTPLYLDFFTYLFCLPISSLNACDYNMAWFRPIAVYYYIFRVLRCSQTKLGTEHLPKDVR